MNRAFSIWWLISAVWAIAAYIFQSGAALYLLGVFWMASIGIYGLLIVWAYHKYLNQ